MTISSAEEYDSVEDLLFLLSRLNIPFAGRALDNFIHDNQDEWTPCLNCDELPSDCCCDGDIRYESPCRCGDKCYC
jgi:hypothetical protein